MMGLSIKKPDKKAVINEIKGYIFMFLGCIAYGASTALFLEPNGVVAGGVTGLAVLFRMIIPAPITVGIWFIVINLPILLLGVKSQGFKFIFRCLVTILTLGLITDLIEIVNINLGNVNVLGESVPLTEDKVLASLYGGLCQGLGIGLFVRFQFSSGGTELLARLISKITNGVSIPVILGLLDGVIVIVGAVATGVENILHALIVVFVSTKLSEVVLVGLEKSKLCIIITNYGEEVSKALISHSPRGVTMLDGEGMYTHKEHNVLLTCVKNNQLSAVKNIISNVDPKAFLIINDSVEVRGQGFKSLSEIDK